MNKNLLILAISAALLWNAAASAADTNIYQATPNSTVRIDGDSTTHKWDMNGTIIGGTFEVPAAVVIDSTQAALTGVGADGLLAAKATARIPVRSIHSHASTLPEVMDNLYQEALKATNNPNIIYSVTEMKLKPGHAAGKPFEFDTKGELAIAGVTNKVTMPVTIETTNTTNLVIAASCPIKMTDYKIEPPAPNIGLGLMKVAPDVTVSFRWVLKPTTTTVAAPASK